MKHFIILACFLNLLATSCSILEPTPSDPIKIVQGAIDLVHLSDDRVRVHITPATLVQDSAIFYIPQMIPGIYYDDDYGQFIDSLKVFSNKGKLLEVLRTSPNTWVIPKSKEIRFIEYLVQDTYDIEGSHNVFSPAGTNFKENEQFLLNLHGMLGYFKNQRELPYYLDIYRPAQLTATTSLSKYYNPLYTKHPYRLTTETSIDTYRAERYFEIIDNPIMYTRANKTRFKIDDIEVGLSVHSPTGLLKATDLQPSIERIMKAQKRYLGTLDATQKYNILLYLSDGSTGDAQGYGALVHHLSTVTVLPEAMPQDQMDKVLQEEISHDFFHIITPLNLHSTQLHKFKYNDPEMSMHLWLYEGVTEYFAQHFQVQQGLIAPQEFYATILDKIEFSSLYDNSMSFTAMSKNIFSEPYASNYGNVYEKGALIGMCLDILMREHSQGERGLLDLMKELIQLYGVNRPFEDSTLIPEIIRRTNPEIGIFFKNHVIGNLPIQYQDFFDLVGLEYQSRLVDTEYLINGKNQLINATPEGEIYILPGTLHTFFEQIGIKQNDIIKSINGKKYTLSNIVQFINDSNMWMIGDPINFIIERDGKELTLSGRVSKPQISKPSLLEINHKNATHQVKIRNSWLKGSYD